MGNGISAHIISPSGNFYGSEQVLFDFLRSTNNKYHVYVPKGSTLYKKIADDKKHVLSSFSSLPLLYYKLALRILKEKKSIYVNEGGHIKYIKLLAQLFPKRNFIVQIRLLDDTSPLRLKKLPKNVKLVCVSKFIASHINNEYNPLVLNDPFVIPPNLESSNKSNFTIGFVGRVTPTKGLKEVEALLEKLDEKQNTIQVNFYGSIEDDKQEVKRFVKNVENLKNLNVHFKGFVDNKKEIYKNLNLVVHLNKEEAFPRIALESWSYGVPFAGFNAGGVGEINNMLGASEFLVETTNSWVNEIIEIINGVKHSYPTKTVKKCRATIDSTLNIREFTKNLDKIILED